MAEKTLFDQIEIRGMVDAWSRYTIEAWRKELRKKKIGVTDELYRSFSHQLQRDGEALMGVMLKFKFYGRLRDMGVGKGLKAYERGSNKMNLNANKRYGTDLSAVSRKPARWFNKRKANQVHRLREILSARTTTAVSNSVSKILTTQSEYNITSNG
jgi:hypothetical protein